MIVDEALKVHIKSVRYIQQSLYVDGDGAALVLGNSGFALVDHLGEFVYGKPFALAASPDPVAYVFRDFTHSYSPA